MFGSAAQQSYDLENDRCYDNPSNDNLPNDIRSKILKILNLESLLCKISSFKKYKCEELFIAT